MYMCDGNIFVKNKIKLYTLFRRVRNLPQTKIDIVFGIEKYAMFVLHKVFFL